MLLLDLSMKPASSPPPAIQYTVKYASDMIPPHPWGLYKVYIYCKPWGSIGTVTYVYAAPTPNQELTYTLPTTVEHIRAVRVYCSAGNILGYWETPTNCGEWDTCDPRLCNSLRYCTGYRHDQTPGQWCMDFGALEIVDDLP